MSLRDDEEQETDSAARSRVQVGGFSLRHMIAGMQSGDASIEARSRDPAPRRPATAPATTPNTAALAHATISAAAPAAAGRFGFSQLGVRHADALRRISERGGATAVPTPPPVGGCRATAVAAARPSPRAATHAAPGTPAAAAAAAGVPGAAGGRPALAGVCNQECREKLREMARGIEASARRMREAEAAAGEQSRAFQDAKQRLAIAARQAEVERAGTERLRATVAAHESTIAAHEATIATHEATIAARAEEAHSASASAAIVEAGLAREAEVAERDRQRVALVAAEQRADELQQAYNAALAAELAANEATVAATASRNDALALAHSMEAEVSALRAKTCPACLGEKERAVPGPLGGVDALRAMTVSDAAISDAAVATGHCLAAGIGVEAGVADVAGEWGEWVGSCDLSHASAKFYSAHGDPREDARGRDSFGSSGDESAPVGAEPAAPADALVGAIIADLKERMEVNIKARISVADKS